jgi:hypothetical protein
MKKHQYRCNRCLIIEERVLWAGMAPLSSVPCSRCGGLAIRLPAAESVAQLFETPLPPEALAAEVEHAGDA